MLSLVPEALTPRRSSSQRRRSSRRAGKFEIGQRRGVGKMVWMGFLWLDGLSFPCTHLMSGRMQTFAAAASAFSALRQGGPSTECDFKYLPAALPEEIVLLCLLTSCPPPLNLRPGTYQRAVCGGDIARDTCPIENNSEEEGRFRKLMFACAQIAA